MYRSLGFAATFVAAATLLTSLRGPQEEAAVHGPFGLSSLSTLDGERASINDFYTSQDCSICHPRQWAEMNGSMHSVAHEDSLYRAFAEMARREAGEQVYTYCSGCHSAAGVATGLIPHLPEEELPEQAKAGVTCDVCHQVAKLTGREGSWGEPANASFALDPGRVKRGPVDEIARNPAHTGVRAEFLESSEFCASCHTVVHPANGLRLEHTYAEWKASVYAQAGVQCQDCHMRSVEVAERVARTLQPEEELGTWARKGGERPIAPHFFVGGNVEAERLGGGARHARMARQRLTGAAELVIDAPRSFTSGAPLELAVVVTNVGAGHDLPTSLTELREMWIELVVRADDGRTLFSSGLLDDHGEIPQGTARFGSGMLDASGVPTFRPWEAASFGWERTIPAKGSDREGYRFDVPAGRVGELAVEARLLYRIAPPHVVDAVLGERAFEPEAVVMASAQLRIAPRRTGS